MTDETPLLQPANLHRAVPRYPDERKHFTPQKTPFSIWFVGFCGNCSIGMGLIAMAIGAVALHKQGIGAGGSFAFLYGLMAIASGAFTVAFYHVAKAVLDMRDMMRHGGGQ